MDGIAPPFTSWKPVVILLYDTRMKRPSAPLIELHLRSKKGGGWIPVYQ